MMTGWHCGVDGVDEDEEDEEGVLSGVEDDSEDCVCASEEVDVKDACVLSEGSAESFVDDSDTDCEEAMFMLTAEAYAWQGQQGRGHVGQKGTVFPLGKGADSARGRVIQCRRSG